MCKKRNRFASAILTILMCCMVLCVPALAVEEEAAEGTLLITVSGIEASEKGQIISLDFDNATGKTCQIGSIFVETESSGSLSYSYTSFGMSQHWTGEIGEGQSSKTITLSDCPPDIALVKIYDVYSNKWPLDKQDIVIYDTSTDMYSGVCDFSNVLTFDEQVAENQRQYEEQVAESQQQYDEQVTESRRQHDERVAEMQQQATKGFALHIIITVIVAIIFAVIIIIWVIVVCNHFKKNKSSKETFQPFAAPGAAHSTHLHRGTVLYVNEINQCVDLMKQRAKEESWNEASLQLRKILEYMVEGIHSANHCALWPQGSGLLEKIDVLYNSGLITRQTQENYHAIRKACNQGAHIDNSVSPKAFFDACKITQNELAFYFGRGAKDKAQPDGTWEKDPTADINDDSFGRQEQERIFREQSEEAMRQHQRFQQQIEREQFDHFTQQSSTPMDQGGFNPPPPPAGF